MLVESFDASSGEGNLYVLGSGAVKLDSRVCRLGVSVETWVPFLSFDSCSGAGGCDNMWHMKDI